MLVFPIPKRGERLKKWPWLLFQAVAIPTRTDIVVVSEGEEKNVANCAQRAISGRATEPKCIFVAAR